MLLVFIQYRQTLIIFTKTNIVKLDSSSKLYVFLNRCRTDHPSKLTLNYGVCLSGYCLLPEDKRKMSYVLLFGCLSITDEVRVRSIQKTNEQQNIN